LRERGEADKMARGEREEMKGGKQIRWQEGRGGR